MSEKGKPHREAAVGRGDGRRRGGREVNISTSEATAAEIKRWRSQRRGTTERGETNNKPLKR
jgi:hypothetical protein